MIDGSGSATLILTQPLKPYTRVSYKHLGLLVGFHLVLTIYAPVIYTATCIMFWMGAYTLRGEVGGGWALEFPSFLGPVK